MQHSEFESINFNVVNKVAFITGAAKGLGRASALALAHAGADIALGLRDVHSAGELEEEIRKVGRKVLRVQMDVSDMSEIKDAVSAVIEYFGRIDILVNNVGVAPPNPAEKVTEDDYDLTMNLNVKANFAFCPFKMNHLPEIDKFVIHGNPFGTYYGDQMIPPGRGNGLGYEAVLLAGPHFHSAAPTYNDHHDRFELILSFFNGEDLSEEMKNDLIAFAHGSMAVSSDSVNTPPATTYASLAPAGFLALPFHDGILFHWESADEPRIIYRIQYHSLQKPEEKTAIATGSSLFVDFSEFLPEDRLLASIEAIQPDGRTSRPSPEIGFPRGRQTASSLNIPVGLTARFFWANLMTCFD